VVEATLHHLSGTRGWGLLKFDDLGSRLADIVLVDVVRVWITCAKRAAASSFHSPPNPALSNAVRAASTVRHPVRRCNRK